MFTRVVELRAIKPGEARELAQTINKQVVPILKRQTGFVDEIVLVSDIEAEHILALSFWKSREDAERYGQEQYPKSQRDNFTPHRQRSADPNLQRRYVNQAQDRNQEGRLAPLIFG
jgi:heme-degrading monooxygenase HmoA